MGHSAEGSVGKRFLSGLFGKPESLPALLFIAALCHPLRRRSRPSIREACLRALLASLCPELRLHHGPVLFHRLVEFPGVIFAAGSRMCCSWAAACSPSVIPPLRPGG